MIYINIILGSEFIEYYNLYALRYKNLILIKTTYIINNGNSGIRQFGRTLGFGVRCLGLRARDYF
jgi:hypothetical protein